MSLLKKSKAFKFSPVAKKSFEYLKKFFAMELIFYKANLIEPWEPALALLYILELDISFIIIFSILS